uniref:Uncharacterized protein n=1 Tax=Anopheles atroparvus TaxID=41427 RepID=A0A182IW20_ANOAO
MSWGDADDAGNGWKPPAGPCFIRLEPPGTGPALWLVNLASDASGSLAMVGVFFVSARVLNRRSFRVAVALKLLSADDGRVEPFVSPCNLRSGELGAEPLAVVQGGCGVRRSSRARIAVSFLTGMARSAVGTVLHHPARSFLGASVPPAPRPCAFRNAHFRHLARNVWQHFDLLLLLLLLGSGEVATVVRLLLVHVQEVVVVTRTSASSPVVSPLVRVHPGGGHGAACACLAAHRIVVALVMVMVALLMVAALLVCDHRCDRFRTACVLVPDALLRLLYATVECALIG